MSLLPLLLSLIGTDLLVYSPGFDTLAEYQQQIAKVFYGQNPVLACDTALPAGLDSAEVYFVGTPDSRYVRRYRDILPVRFSGDTVALGDSVVVASDYVFHCQFRTTQDHGIELTLARSPEMAAGETELFGRGFILSRKRDGVDRSRDRICHGNLESYGGSLHATNVIWNAVPDRTLDTIADRYIKFYFEPGLLNRDEMQSFFRVAELEYEALTLAYGLVMPKPVFIYLTSGDLPDGKQSSHTARMNTIWLRCADRAALLDTMEGPVYGLAYDLAGIAFQPLSDEYPSGRLAADWAQCAAMTVILPYVGRALGRSNWLAPTDYSRLGPERFRKLYTDGKTTYAWLLHEIERTYSSRVVGDAIRRVLVGKLVPLADLKEFMTLLATLTGDKGIIRRVAGAFPTPLNATLYQTRGWYALGARPALGDMFLDREFNINSVEPGSQADAIGFRANDRILKIAGYNPASDRVACLRHLLRQAESSRIVFLVQRGRKQETIVFAP
jgi:hypothetical protein